MKHIPIWVEKLQATNERETNGIFNNPTSSEFRSQSQQRKCIQSYLYQLKPTILKICRGICYKKNVCYYYANRDLVVGLKLPQRNNVGGSLESTMMESEYVNVNIECVICISGNNSIHLFHCNLNLQYASFDVQGNVPGSIIMQCIFNKCVHDIHIYFLLFYYISIATAITSGCKNTVLEQLSSFHEVAFIIRGKLSVSRYFLKWSAQILLSSAAG